MDRRLGIDVGGTFTDFVLLTPEGVMVHKRPTTPDDPLRAVAEGMLALGVPADTPVIHGTTIVTNAVLQGRGARTALVATRGFADVLAIGRQERPGLYDLRARPPRPLVPPDLRFEVDERVGADGRAITPLDLGEVDRLADELARGEVESVAICLLFSFLSPDHERRLAERLRARLPHIFLSCSCEAAPEFREYERTSTTVIDAFAGPLAAGYVRRLRGVAPTVQLMQSSGGLTSPEAAARHPVTLALSGPAGGVAGVFAVANAHSPRLIGLDMGGTSTDVALCDGAVPLMMEGSLGGWPVRQPMVAVHTIGAGGGSIARVDAGGLLRVGPASAGADPGPACYGRGADPTVTDADLLLGRLAPSGLLAGSLHLHAERARAALARLGRELGLDAEGTAAGIVRVVDAAMARALAHVSVEQGHDPRRFTLVPFGGAGAMHACELADRLALGAILIPRWPGVLSALGMTLADETRDYRRTILRPASALSDGELAALFAPLLEAARREAGRDAEFVRSVDARYAGQSFELTVPADGRIGQVATAFHALHTARYGYSRPDRPIEIVTLRLRSRIPGSRPLPSAGVAGGDPVLGRCRTWFADGWHDTIVLDRGSLAPGHPIEGPALLVQDDATAVVAPGWRGRVEASGNVVLRRTTG